MTSRSRPSARSPRKRCPRWRPAMRIIDLHCYPGTKEWIACQGPYVEALAKYWNRGWTGKAENEVIRDFTDAGVQAVLVALDLETTIGTPPVTNEYVKAMWQRHPDRIIQAWGAVERSEEHTSELQSLAYLVCRLLLEKKKNQY